MFLLQGIQIFPCRNGEEFSYSGETRIRVTSLHQEDPVEIRAPNKDVPLTPSQGGFTVMYSNYHTNYSNFAQSWAFSNFDFLVSFRHHIISSAHS